MKLKPNIKEYLAEKLDITESELDSYINIVAQFDKDKDLDDICFHLAEAMNKIGYVKTLIEHYETPTEGS